MNPNLDSVLGHIMFHKALISEEESGRKLDLYLSIARDFQMEQDVVTRDPVDRSMQLVFDLVLNNNFDPWDVDLVSFTDLYLRRMRESEVNFIVAGRLVFMAWSVLKMQSEEVLAASQDQHQLFCSDWDFDVIDDCFVEAGPSSVQTDVPECVDLCEAIRHQEHRPVSLVELLDAFEDARAEAEMRERRTQLREALKVSEQRFDPKSHSEDLEKDVEEVWKRILRCGNGPVAIDDLFAGGKDDRVTVFISLLFLARNGKIALWQDDLPYGQIFMEVKLPWDIGTLEDAKAAAALPHQSAVM